MAKNPFETAADALAGKTTTTTRPSTVRAKPRRNASRTARGDAKVKAAYRTPKKRKSSTAPKRRTQRAAASKRNAAKRKPKVRATVTSGPSRRKAPAKTRRRVAKTSTASRTATQRSLSSKTRKLKKPATRPTRRRQPIPTARLDRRMRKPKAKGSVVDRRARKSGGARRRK